MAPVGLFETLWHKGVPPREENGPAELIPEGERNDTLFRAACRMRAEGLEQALIVDSLRTMNKTACQEPVTDSELTTIAESACKYERGTARSQELEMFFFRFKPSEWLSDARILLMSDRQRSWYFQLYCHAWLKVGRLPNDPKKLFQLSGASCSFNQFSRSIDPIYEFFEVDPQDDRVLVHRELEAFWHASYELGLKRRKAGRASAEAKKKAREEAS
jgi:hypothetical protein